MAIDPSKFERFNVTDTCAVWNVLSSVILYRTARNTQCSFCCTSFVVYECLHKPRTKSSPSDAKLRSRMLAAQADKQFVGYDLDIADLQNVALLEQRKRLGKGELSSIAFAVKTRQAFLTDDQNARKLAAMVIASHLVQTTPHLYGWLHFQRLLNDGDHGPILLELQECDSPLGKYFTIIYEQALGYRLIADRKNSMSAGENPPDK